MPKDEALPASSRAVLEGLEAELRQLDEAAAKLVGASPPEASPPAEARPGLMDELGAAAGELVVDMIASGVRGLLTRPRTPPPPRPRSRFTTTTTAAMAGTTAAMAGTLTSPATPAAPAAPSPPVAPPPAIASVEVVAPTPPMFADHMEDVAGRLDIDREIPRERSPKLRGPIIA